MKRLFSLSVCILLCIAGFAQDKHFTQFYIMPAGLNPALVGTMPGKYRAVLIYRNQWLNVMDNSFKTFGGGFDIRLPIGMKNIDAIGAGITFFTDKGGIGAFNTNQIDVSFAYHKSLGFRKTQYLSAGFTMGLAQRNVNYDDLTFNDQFDGETGYVLVTDEPLPDNNYTYGDLSAGLHFNSKPSDRQSIQAGISVFHANLPNIAFNKELIDRLDPRITVNFSGSTPLNRKMDLLPRLVVSYQGPHLEANVGSNIKFMLSDYAGTALYVGALVRPVRDVEKGIAVDAVALLTAFELNNILLGFSYDVNVSSLIKSTSSVGAFELSFTFQGKNENAGVLCPTF